MGFKKWFGCVVVLCSFFLWGGLAPVHADEAALINLLKKKNIITEQEATELLQELRNSSQKEKTEIKKEVKAEVKEDIQKDAGKGEFLPKSLRGFKLGAQIFAEWNSVNRYDGLPSTASTSSNQFALNRGQFTLSRDINDWLGMNLTADVYYVTTNATTLANSGPELRLKTAAASMKYAGTTTDVGLVNTTSDGYDNSIWPYRVQAKHLLDELGIMGTYDYGIANQGVFGGYMDAEYLQYAVRPYAGKWGGYRVGLYNGGSYTRLEGNNNKVITGLVYFRPLPNTPVLKGLQLAYVGAWGQSNLQYTAANQPRNTYPVYQVNMVQASLLHPWFGVMAQYYWGKGTAGGDEDNERLAYLASAFVRIPGVKKLRAFGKYYNYDPDTYRDKNDYNVFVAGLSYDVSPELMPFIAWEHRDNGSKVSGNDRIDYHKYQVGVQLKF